MTELDEAAPLARGFDRMIRRPVVMPSVANKTTRCALDVHHLSLRAMGHVRQTRATVASPHDDLLNQGLW